MKRKRHTPEQVIRKLREAEADLAAGKDLKEVCRKLGIVEKMAEFTAFDFVLLLIISETTQAGLVGDNKSLTNSFLLIVTLVGLDVALSFFKQRSQRIEKILDGVPLIIVADGVPLKDRMEKERIDEDDILAAARKLRGLRGLDEIRYAVLERNGGITIIPNRELGKTDELAL